MNKRNYNQLIVERLGSSLNMILPVGAVFAFMAAFAVYSVDATHVFVKADIITGLLLMAIFLFRNRIDIEHKVSISVGIPIILGILAKVEGGFGSVAMVLVLLGNVLAVLLLSRAKGFAVFLVSTFVMLVLHIGVYSSGLHNRRDGSLTVWMLQILIMVLFIIVLQTVVHEIRHYLLENIYGLEEAVNQTEKVAYYDDLTGIYSKQGFIKELEFQLEDTGRSGFVILIKLRNLNMIKAIFGERDGDEILMKASTAVTKLLSDEEIFGRVGGNEFAIWTECKTSEDVRQKLLGIKGFFVHSPTMPIFKDRLEYYVSCAPYEGSGSIRNTYEDATVALTYAKHHKILKLVTYDKAFKHRLQHEDYLRESLKRAICNYEMTMYYQPVVDPVTENTVRVEALARWSTDEACTSPSVFVPLTEDMNLSIPFGKMTVSLALHDYKSLCAKYGQGVLMSLNISPTLLMSEDFIGYLAQSVTDRGVDPSAIILEITEEVLINGVEEVDHVLSALRDKGFRISLDDFGSGYSSLRYLTMMHVDELKIDRVFIQQITVNDHTRILVEAIIRLGKAYGLDVVAEGIETEDEKDLLVGMGCDTIQGFYYGRPECIEGL